MGDVNLFKVEDSVCLKRVGRKTDVLKSDSCDGYLIESSEKEARRIIESLRGSGKKIGVVGGDDAFNRRVVESLRVDYLVSPEGGDKVNGLKQRDSGINHVVAKIMRDKGILIVVDMNDIKKLEGKELALRLARIMQNVRICRKAGCGIRICSFGSKKGDVFGEKERRAFGVSLGMSSKQSSEATLF